MELVKGNWTTDSTTISMSIPISKVDKANRRVQGWATLDNVDRANEQVTKDASVRAFASFSGNIREMHQPIAAGRLVDFKEDSFYDNKTNKTYNGIWVDAYVSAGAEDTWQKVLDGTLTGFSIGGNITDADMEFNKDAGISVRIIKGYDLTELSLVDVPCNQLANVFSIVKSAEGSFMKGMVAETSVLNTFWCSTDEIAKNSDSETLSCLHCGADMEKVGWIESGHDDALKTAEVVNKFLRQKEDGNAVAKANTTDNGEGGVTMSEEITKSADESVAEENAAEAVVEAPVEEAVEVKAEEGVVEAPVEPDLEKLFGDFQNNIKDSIQKTVEGIEKKVSDATAAFDEKASEFEKSLGELGDKLNSIKTEREEVAKRLEALESKTAIKKSGEVEAALEGTTTVKKGFWNSAILGD